MKLVLCCVAIVEIVARSAHAAPPSADVLRSEIARDGAKAVVDGLLRRNEWEPVSDRIASGRSDWLALAPLLAEGTDAGTSEDLGIDLAFALPKNPDAVLRAANQTKRQEGGIIGIERVCGAPFVEDTEPKGYLSRAAAAVRSVNAPDLQAKKQACLAELRSVRP